MAQNAAKEAVKAKKTKTPTKEPPGGTKETA
jgi:hypothetical protein